MNNEQRKILIDLFHGVCGMLLFSFAKHDCDIKNQILRNFIARTDMMVQGIYNLWMIGDIQDCWIIFRCLLDRLFHINHVSENCEFEQFDDWSFYQQYNTNNRISSDREFRMQSEVQFLKPTKAQKERYKKLSESPPNWQRPFPESVAKKMGLSFLYKYGYDYGSTHVHPLANDGLQDFYTITKLEPRPEFPDSTTVFSNSVLVASLIVQEVLNSSDFNWRAVVYSFFESIRKNIGNYEDTSFNKDFMKISVLFQGDGLCEQKMA